MVDLYSALRTLVEEPLASPEPVGALQARLERRRRRRAQALGLALVGMLVVVLGALLARVGGRDRDLVETGVGASAGSAPGGGLVLTYVPEGYALADDVEHTRHELGDRLRVVTYRKGREDEELSFEVTRTVGNPLDVEAEVRLHPDVVPTTVRGMEGVVSRSGAPYAFIEWLVTREVTLSVGSAVLDRAELWRIAEGIRYDSDADDLALHEVPGPVDPGDGNRRLSEKMVVDRGEVDGVEWELVAYESDRGLCIDLRFYRTSGGGCGFHVPDKWALNAGIAGGGADLQFIHGAVREDVVEVRVEFLSGRALNVATVGGNLGHGVRFFATPVRMSDAARSVVGLNAAGEEVARQQLHPELGPPENLES